MHWHTGKANDLGSFSDAGFITVENAGPVYVTLLERKAQRNFLKNTGKNQYELDSDKINAHARFDGFKAIWN